MASSDVPLVASTSTIDRIRFFDAYRRLGENPNTLQNCLLLTLAQILPVVGQLTLVGYICMAIRQRVTRDEPWPEYHDFDEHRFGRYIGLGFKIVLADLVWTLLIGIVLILPAAALIAIAANLDGYGYGPGPFTAFLGLGVQVVSSLAMWIIIMPILLRITLTGQLRQMFNFQSLPRYIRLVWPEQVMAYLFITWTGWLLIVLGLMFCGIGALFALVIIGLAHADLQAQIYRLYLARGGEPIKEIPE